MTKAIVYLWPLMSKPAIQEEEHKLVEAGYSNKAQLTIKDRFIDQGKRIKLKVWKVT